MKPSEHLDFFAPDDIRIRGTRVGIETVVHEFLAGRSPDEIVASHPVLSLGDVHGTLAYYFQNRDDIDSYLSHLHEVSRRAREEQDRNPSPGVARLRAMKHGDSNGMFGRNGT